MSKNKIIAILLVFIVLIGLTFSYLINDEKNENVKPNVEIIYPDHGSIVSKIVKISGTASDPDGDDEFLEVEIKIDGKWNLVEGNNKWSYEWKTYDIDDGPYTIKVRSWDGDDYSVVKEINMRLQELFRLLDQDQMVMQEMERKIRVKDLKLHKVHQSIVQVLNQNQIMETMMSRFNQFQI